MRGFWATAALASLLLLVGCGEETIDAPTTKDFQKERAALTAKMKQKARQATARIAQAPAQAAAAQPAESGFQAVDVGYAYDPTGKRDPFRSFRWERQPDLDEEAVGPLEQFELGQLSVVAVVWDVNRPRALVEDPSGRSYIVQEGTKVGKNDGTIIHIGDNLVLVKETYVDFAGVETTKDVELRIRKSQGG